MNCDEMQFPNENTVRRRKTICLGYEADDELANLNLTEKFRTTFLLVPMDNAISSFSDRFSKLRYSMNNLDFIRICP